MEQPLLPNELLVPTSQSTVARIKSLPLELLLLIFQYSYENFQCEEKTVFKLASPPWHCISGGLDPSSMRPTSPSDILERFRSSESSSRFPFGLAAVSHLWRDLLLSQPNYWTEIVCYTAGLDPSNLEFARMGTPPDFYPRDVPLDLIILRGQSNRDKGSETEEMLQERIELRTIAKNFFSRHFDRIQSIVIETQAGASFMDTLTRDNGGITLEGDTILSSIFSTQKKGVPSPEIRLSVLLPHIKDYSYPFLTTLSIHGTDVDVFYPMGTRRGHLYSSLEQLTLSDYRSSRLSIPDFSWIFSFAPLLRKLHLRNIELDPYSSLEYFADCSNLDFLHLESMSPSMITSLFRVWLIPSLKTLQLTRCVYRPITPRCPETLILDELPVGPMTCLATHLSYWVGTTLWIGRYNNPSDLFLDFFSKKADLQPQFMEVHTLYLYQIPVLSFRRLKKMVRKRNKSVDYADPNWRTNTVFHPPILQKLSIDQCGIKRLTEEQIKWFSERLKEFVYIP